jgi:glucose-1-phosphate cytidylyltransferase
MKVVILAGGFGTRISEHTDAIPKPMLPIGGKPLLWHIMQWYASFGHKEFIIALGYKEEVIRNYFLNFYMNTSDFEVNLHDGSIEIINDAQIDWKVKLISTGLETMTGGRIKRLEPHLKGESFLMTYGDGVCDVNLDELNRTHNSFGGFATLTAVRPTARFGELAIDGAEVVSFDEKPHVDSGWINGGFMVLEPEVFKFIDGDATMFEREPLSKIAADGKLAAHFHDGFWQCVDTKREYDRIQELFKGDPAWISKK